MVGEDWAGSGHVQAVLITTVSIDTIDVGNLCRRLQPGACGRPGGPWGARIKGSAWREAAVRKTEINSGRALHVEVGEAVALESASHEFDMRGVDESTVLPGIEIKEAVDRRIAGDDETLLKKPRLLIRCLSARMLSPREQGHASNAHRLDTT